jgi:hypothetical protein
LSFNKCTQGTPAGLLIPLTAVTPGIFEEIDGAVQHAPHSGRQFMFAMPELR